MSTTIDVLELEIQTNSKNTVNGIDALTQSLTKLRSATKGGLGLTAVANQINNISTASSNISSSTIGNLSGLAKAIGLFNGVKISPNIATQITAISNSLQSADFTNGANKISVLMPSLKSLASLPKISLSSYIKNLTKLQEALSKLDTIDIDSVRIKIKELADAFKPLGDEMQKVANGFSSFPTQVQKLLNVTNKMNSSNKQVSFGFGNLNNKIKSVINGIKKIYSLVEKSNEYIENVNLFTVAMGSYANEAMSYAEKVSDAMGVDVSEWVRSQGIFMTMATGFGVAGDRAALMSKNLTQLGYDISSFYNIDVETAMLKLKSGLAGELEPLRAIGYDLSQAKLEATALALGIDKSVTSMTQAEKAQLRYYAIMTQVTTAHGDLARTLDDPANQVRMLKAQFNMAARDIGNIFIPMLQQILPVAIAVTKVIRSIAQSIASLVGYVPDEVGEGAVAMVENTDAVTEGLEDAQEEAKKLKSYMLGFDELNVINPDTSNAVDSSGSEFNFDLPDYTETFWSNLSTNPINELVEKMKEWLGITDEIDSWADLLSTKFGNILITVGYIGAALLLWRISTSVLAFIRNFELFAGGLKVLGAVAIIGAAIAGASWLVMNTESTVGKIGAILSGASLALGAILAFTGINLPLGIALMAIGAVSLATAIALKTDKLSDEIKGVIATITSIVSVALLAVGAILAFSGANIPLGIALMAGGAITMITTIIPNWNTLSDSVKTTISIITASVGGALLALGAILAFSGVAIPLGIGLMLVGAASLGTAMALNWDSISKALKGTIGSITAIVSAALIVIGSILLFTGAGIPLGLGLILAGAAGLATTIVANWDCMGEFLKTTFASLLAIISGAMLVIGVLLLLTGGGIGLGLALIFGALKLSETAWKLDDNPITNFVKNMMNGVIKVINGVIDAINKLFDISFPGLSIKGIEIIPSFNTKLLNIPKIPLMAEGGFPEQGQMFIAREAGAEMVGNIGRRTAVANNDQIVSSISGGVAEANEEQNALLREQNSLLREILEKDSGVYIDGKHLTDSVEKYQRERGRVLVTGGVI